MYSQNVEHMLRVHGPNLTYNQLFLIIFPRIAMANKAQNYVHVFTNVEPMLHVRGPTQK